jgi:hypothetical protein
MIANSTAAVNAGRFPPAFLAVSMSLTSDLLISATYFASNAEFRSTFRPGSRLLPVVENLYQDGDRCVD